MTVKDLCLVIGIDTKINIYDYDTYYIVGVVIDGADLFLQNICKIDISKYSLDEINDANVELIYPNETGCLNIFIKTNNIKWQKDHKLHE